MGEEGLSEGMFFAIIAVMVLLAVSGFSFNPNMLTSPTASSSPVAAVLGESVSEQTQEPEEEPCRPWLPINIITS